MTRPKSPHVGALLLTLLFLPLSCKAAMNTLKRAQNIGKGPYVIQVERPAGHVRSLYLLVSEEDNLSQGQFATEDDYEELFRELGRGDYVEILQFTPGENAWQSSWVSGDAKEPDHYTDIESEANSDLIIKINRNLFLKHAECSAALIAKYADGAWHAVWIEAEEIDGKQGGKVILGPDGITDHRD